MSKCKHCKEVIDLKEVKRVYGEESSVALGGFCTARCYTLDNTKVIEPTGLQKVLGKLSLQTIPENALLDKVVKELKGREVFTDTDSTNDERIYSGDVFEQILVEKFKVWDTQKDIDQLEELSKLVSADYILVTQS